MAELQDSPGGLINQFAVRPEAEEPEPEPEPAAKHSRRPHLGKK